MTPALARQFLGGLIILMCLGGCVSAPQSTALLQRFEDSSVHATALHYPSKLLLDSVPFFAQEQYQCGPAALATVLQASHVSVLPDALVAQVYVPSRKGSLQVEMLAAARRYGRVAYTLPPSLEALLAELQSGRPVLVMQNLGLERFAQWHYAVVVGYDLAEEKLILRSGMVKEYRLALSTFERTWQRAEHWAVVMLAPGEMPVNAEETRYFEAVSGFAQVAENGPQIIAYEAGLALWPRSTTLGMALGNLHYEARRLVLAREVYSTVLVASPNYAVAHNNLAQVLFELDELALAKEHAEKAVALGGSFSENYNKTLESINQSLINKSND